MGGELQLERMKLRYRLLEFLIGTVGFSVISLSIASYFKDRELVIKERDVERLEIEQLGKYIDHALTDNVATRERFARYFWRVSRSQEMKKGWEDYLTDVAHEKQQAVIEVAELAATSKELERLAASNKSKAEELKLVREKLRVAEAKLIVRQARDAVAPGATLTGHASAQAGGSAMLSSDNEQSKGHRALN